MSRSSIWLCKYLLSSFAALAPLGKDTGVDLELAPPKAGADPRDESSAALSREMDVASVDAVLRTLTADELGTEETASIELSVEAMLCLEALRRSMLSGRDAATRRGLRVLLLLVGVGVDWVDDVEAAPDDAADANEGNFGVEEEAHKRPRKREAAVVTSDACAASVLLVALSSLASLYPCSSAAIRSLVTTLDRFTKSCTNWSAL